MTSITITPTMTTDGRLALDITPLAEAIRRCWSFKRVSYEAGKEDPAWLTHGYEQHLAIIDALERRDGETAMAAARYHLRSAASFRPAEKVI